MAVKPSSTAVTPTNIPQKLQSPKQSATEQHEKRIKKTLSYPILLSDQIAVAVNDSNSFKFECSEVGKKVDRICQMLRSAARLATSSTPGALFYDRPLRRIAAEVSRNLEKSLTLVVDFFNQVNILYATVTEFYTSATCPKISAGPKYEYRWADGVTIKKPIVVSAPKYVEYLMDWIEAQLDNQAIFPQKLGVPFPPNFEDVVKTILRRLFRVYAHIYHSHFQKIMSLKEEPHLNTCFKHFVLFTCEFGLIDKCELAALQDIVDSILQG